MTFRLAYVTTRLAFNLLGAREVRGLVWTASPVNPDVGSVHFDLDPNYPRASLAINLSNEMTKQLQVYGAHCISSLSFLEAHADQVLFAYS